VSRVGAGLDLRGGATGEGHEVAAIGSMRGLCLQFDRAGPRGWQRGATSSHVEAHISSRRRRSRWRPATPCGRRKRGAMWDPLRQRQDQPQPKLGRGNSATDAAWRLPRKEVRERDEYDADAGLPSA
jgi:hypothetical protein